MATSVSHLLQVLQARSVVLFIARSLKVKPDAFRLPIEKIITLLMLLPTLIFGQQDSLRKRPDILRFADGVLYTYSAPARWDGKDWLVFGGLIGSTAAFTLIDEPVRDFFQTQDNRFLDAVERVGYHYGKPYSAFGFTAGFYLTGLIFKNEWCKETGLVLGSTLLTSGLLQTISKDAIGRARPDTELGHLEFNPFSHSAAYHSFPSGHFAVAFGISVVLARRVENIPLKILFYSLAGSTAVSRLYFDAHWASDMYFGGMLAWFCADAAIARMKVNRFKRIGSKDKMVWKVYPYPGGITLRASIP